MAEARGMHEWNQAALIAALIANANRDTKKKPQPFTAKDFHPYLKHRKQSQRKLNKRMPGNFINSLAEAFGAKRVIESKVE